MDIVERLRGFPLFYRLLGDVRWIRDDSKIEPTCAEAADTIEALRKQVAELTKERDTLEELYGSEFNLNNELVGTRAALRKQVTEKETRLQDDDKLFKAMSEQLAAMTKERDLLRTTYDMHDKYLAAQARILELEDEKVVSHQQAT